MNCPHCSGFYCQWYLLPYLRFLMSLCTGSHCKLWELCPEAVRVHKCCLLLNYCSAIHLSKTLISGEFIDLLLLSMVAMTGVSNKDFTVSNMLYCSWKSFRNMELTASVGFLWKYWIDYVWWASSLVNYSFWMNGLWGLSVF